MAKRSAFKMIAYVIGIPLTIAYVLYTFAIGPYLFPGYPLTLPTVLAFANPIAVFVFLGLWALLASATGVTAIIIGRRR